MKKILALALFGLTVPATFAALPAAAQSVAAHEQTVTFIEIGRAHV